jgi:hypothetical protein
MRCLQNSHYIGVAAKIVFLKELWDKKKSPAWEPGFSFSFCTNYSDTDITHTPRDSPYLARVFDDPGLYKIWSGSRKGLAPCCISN